jgi:hypothetical protein
MTLTSRDRRALALLAAAAIPMLMYSSCADSAPETVEVAADPIETAEKQLARLREQAATLPVRQAAEAESRRALDTRERGILNAPTAEQAQAQLLQVVRRLSRNEKIDARGGEFGPVRPLGDDYGEVSVAVSFECGIEQLVNLLASIAAERELLATNEIQIGTANPQMKTLNVRLVLAGVIPRKLVPERRGL